MINTNIKCIIVNIKLTVYVEINNFILTLNKTFVSNSPTTLLLILTFISGGKNGIIIRC